jgi:hypothetical protein
MYRKHSMEKYLVRRRLVVAPFLRSATVAAALTACSVGAQAASVQTVFSAENALYGAGYNAGQADGWIDDSLSAAVTQYQTDHPDLRTTGELDEPTLDALGISGSRSQLMSGNGVANAEAARKELGLKVASAPKSAPAPAPTPVPKAEPKPEPKPAQPVATPEPAAKPTVEPAPVIASAPEVKEPVPKPEPQKAPEPTSEPIMIASSARTSSRDEPAAAPELGATPEETANVASVYNTEKTEAAVPQESAAARNDQEKVSTEAGSQSQPTDRQGNVITRMFDFLFGWMV